jgi:hypothetical protein
MQEKLLVRMLNRTGEERKMRGEARRRRMEGDKVRDVGRIGKKEEDGRR